jgi:hypothetical protein
LITQRTVAQGLGVRQRAAWWFYYEIGQNGSDLTVKRGLVCGNEVYPLDLLAASVQFKAAFPELVKKSSNAGRRGKAIASGSSCNVSFEKSYDIVGATTPYYKDPNIALPTLEQQASGSTPGWEDWDADGEPAVSLIVSGIANGSRYTVLRVFSEWSGTIAAGATTFKIAVPDWGQQESVLGVTSDLLTLTGEPDADPSGHFTQFAKLTPDQVKADDLAMCDFVRMQAATLTPEANQ